MSSIHGHRALGTFTGIAWGIVMMAVGFVFPHVPRVLAAIMFDIGGLVAASCLILLLVE